MGDVTQQEAQRALPSSANQGPSPTDVRHQIDSVWDAISAEAENKD